MTARELFEEARQANRGRVDGAQDEAVWKAARAVLRPCPVDR